MAVGHGGSCSFVFSFRGRDDGRYARIARARLRLKDRKGEVVEEITLEYRNHTAPANEPDRVAISLINEVNRSPKVAAIAQKRTKAAPGAEPAPASPPDAGTTSL